MSGVMACAAPGYRANRALNLGGCTPARLDGWRAASRPLSSGIESPAMRRRDAGQSASSEHLGAPVSFFVSSFSPELSGGHMRGVRETLFLGALACTQASNLAPNIPQAPLHEECGVSARCAAGVTCLEYGYGSRSCEIPCGDDSPCPEGLLCQEAESDGPGRVCVKWHPVVALHEPCRGNPPVDWCEALPTDFISPSRGERVHTPSWCLPWSKPDGTPKMTCEMRCFVKPLRRPELGSGAPCPPGLECADIDGGPGEVCVKPRTLPPSWL
jgi:hypothetical protein